MGIVKYKESFYNQSPKKIDEGMFPINLLNKAKGKEFLALERVKGISFMIVIDDLKVIVYSDEKSDEIVEFINNEHSGAITKLIKHFESVNMTIYGEYITHDNSINKYIGSPKIYFYDMFINDNWIKNDDFIEIFNELKLPIPPVIRNGALTQDYINNLSKIVNSNSLINGLNGMFGVYVKSLNGIGEHRGISKGAYVYYNPKYVGKDTSKKTNNETLRKKIEEIGLYTINEEIITRWEVMLVARDIVKLKSNLNQIMPILMNDYIKNHKEEIEILALDEDITREDSEKMIKKYIPKVIIEKMF